MIHIWTTHLTYMDTTQYPYTVNCQWCLLKSIMEFTSSSELWDTPHSFVLKFYKLTFTLFTFLLLFYSCLSHYPHLFKNKYYFPNILYPHIIFLWKPSSLFSEFWRLIIPMSFPKSRRQHVCLLVYKAKTCEVYIISQWCEHSKSRGDLNSKISFIIVCTFLCGVCRVSRDSLLK